MAWSFYNTSGGIITGGVSSIAGTANEITVTPTTGDSVVSLPAALTFTGKTVTGGTFNSPTIDSPVITTFLKLTAGIDIRPTANSTTAINISQADGTDFVIFDTTNRNMILDAGANNDPFKLDTTTAAHCRVLYRKDGTVIWRVGA